MKKNIFCVFLLLLSFSLFAETTGKMKKAQRSRLKESFYIPTTTETVDEMDYNVIDELGFPSYEKNDGLLNHILVGGIHSFAVIISEFGDIVVSLCVFFCFLCIVFNCFKLWFGTTELKKVFVDIIYKCVICIITLLCFRPFTDSLIALATNIGGSISGGYKTIDSVYVTAYKNMLDKIEKGLEDITSTMMTNAVTANDGNKYISQQMVDELKTFGMSDESIEAWAKQNEINIAKPFFRLSAGGEELEWNKEMDYGEDVIESYKDQNGNVIKFGKDGLFKPASAKFSKAMIKSAKSNNKKIDEKKQIELVSKLDALLEVLDGEGVTPEDLETDINTQQKQKKLNGIDTLKNMMYNPFLVNKNGDRTMFISPGDILKTITVMNDAVAFGTTKTIDEQNGEIEDRKLNPSGTWTFKGLINTITALIYKLGMFICCVIVLSEYTLTLLEFYLVRALATLLIPFLFLDATKSFAENIIRILMNYFFKILITVFVCYFSLGLFLDTSIITFNVEQNTLNLVLYISTLTIGTMFCSKIPSILGTLMSGNPSMGWGTIAETARGAAHGMHMAHHAAQTVGKLGTRTLQGMGRGFINAGNTLRGVSSASESAMSAAKAWNSQQTSDASKLDVEAMGGKAGRAYLRNSIWQHTKDNLYSAFTGQKAERKNVENGLNFGKLGQTYVDENGVQKTASASLVKGQNKKAGESIGKDVVAKMTKPIKDAAMSTIKNDGKPNVRGREAGLPD